MKTWVIDEARGAANPPSSLALGLGGGGGAEPSAQPEHAARRWEAAFRDQGSEPGPDNNASSEEPRWWHEARQGGEARPRCHLLRRERISPLVVIVRGRLHDRKSYVDDRATLV